MTTPVCDLIEQLLSGGTSPGDAITAARLFEVAMARPSGSTAEQRQRWRLKKERQRARLRGTSPGDEAKGISYTNTDSSKVKRKKPEPAPGDVSPPQDGWPDDHVEVFWKAFPPYRRQSKAKVAAKLGRIRADGKVAWGTLIEGVRKFAATSPGEYAPAPMVWLNDGRWDREYGTGGSNGKAQAAGERVGFSGIAARLRAKREGDFDDDPARPAPEDLQPINRR